MLIFWSFVLTIHQNNKEHLFKVHQELAESVSEMS